MKTEELIERLPEIERQSKVISRSYSGGASCGRVEAHLRLIEQDVPALCAAVRELAAENERLKDENEDDIMRCEAAIRLNREELDQEREVMGEQYRQVKAENERLRETLEASEDYRRAYQSGKYSLYAMADDKISSAVMQHLPCNEGPLDRRFRELIESPRLKARDGAIARLREENERLNGWIERADGFDIEGGYRIGKHADGNGWSIWDKHDDLVMLIRAETPDAALQAWQERQKANNA